MWSTAFYLASRNVTRKRERSLLTVIGVLLAVGAFISLLSIAEGLYLRVHRELDGRGVDIYVMPSTALPVPVGPLAGVGESTETVAPAIVTALAGIQNVEAVSAVTHFQQVLNGRSLVVWGIEPKAYPTFLPLLEFPQGRAPQGKNEILVGPAIAREMKLSDGGTISLAQRSFTIIGISTPVGGLQDYFCYVSAEAALEVTGHGPQEVWVRLRERGGSAVTCDDINKDPHFRGYLARTRTQYLGAASDFINYAWLVQFAVAAIGVLIATTAAMNTMLMATYERMREFGTLRAIGASRYVVMAMLVIESLILSTVGGVCGTVLGVMGSGMMDAAISTLFRLTIPVAKITLSLLVEAFLLSGFVGLVGAAVPCFLVYRMNIIEGLRQD
jgi:putative ABC transport system permease protein